MSLVTQFLTQINQYVRRQQGDNLRAWLQVEPNSAKTYYDMAAELRAKFSTANSLDAVIETHLPIDDDVPEGQGTAWPSFQSFMKDYLTLWRDIDYGDLLGSHGLLTALVKYVFIFRFHPNLFQMASIIPLRCYQLFLLYFK